MTNNTSDLRFSLSESARLFGISQRTLRRAIADQQLPFTLVQGRYKLRFSDVLKWSSASPRTIAKRDTDGIGQFVAIWKSAQEIEAREAQKVPEAKKVIASAPESKIGSIPSQATAEEPILNWD